MAAWKQRTESNLSALQRCALGSHVPVRSLRFSISPYYGGLFYIILLVVQMLAWSYNVSHVILCLSNL